MHTYPDQIRFCERQTRSVMGIFSESRLALHNDKAKQHQQHRNNNLDTCFACALIELPLQTLFQAQEPVPQNAECPPSPPIKIPFLYGKIKVLVKGFGIKQQKQQKEPKRIPNSPCSISFLHRDNRRLTGDSDCSCRSFRSMRTLYSRMVSPAGSACGVRGCPSLDSPAMTETPGGDSSVCYPTTPITPPPTPPLCGHVSSGGVCEKCTDIATTCQHWISGVEETDPTHEQEPPELEPAPETPREGRSSPLLLPEEGEERPLIGLGIEMPSVVYGERDPLLANPSSSPPPTQLPAPRKRKERPAPVLTTYNLRRRVSWEVEKNCDTASAATTPSSKHTGATFAIARVQNVSKGRSTFEDSQEMPCTFEHCGGHGRCWNTTATAFFGSNRDSGTTLAASLHSQSEDKRRGTAAAMFTGSGRDSGATLAASVRSGSEGRPECKQHLEGVHCSLKHCGRYQVGVGSQLESPENKRRVSRIVGGLVAAFTKSISWLRGKGWPR